jgi:hypothetical protein
MTFCSLFYRENNKISVYWFVTRKLNLFKKSVNPLRSREWEFESENIF